MEKEQNKNWETTQYSLLLICFLEIILNSSTSFNTALRNADLNIHRSTTRFERRKKMYVYIIYTYKYILHAHPLKQLENMQAAKRQSLQLSQITWAFCALIPRFLHAQWSHAAWDDWNDIRMVSDTKSLKQTRVRCFKTKTKECHHQAAWFESCTMGRVSLKLDAVQRANRKRRIEPWKSPYRIFPKIPSPSNQAYVFNKRENSWIYMKINNLSTT